MKSFLLLITAMGLLAACNTVQGIGEDMQSAGNAIKRTAE